MAEPIWGLLGPETIRSRRRTRTLDLGAVVREFNELAVPGLGGVWFGKQAFLALLGIVLAQRVRSKRLSNIQVANAVEALGCLLAFEDNGWQRDPRLRGVTKLKGKGNDKKHLSFPVVSQSGFYVSQPMRMGTTNALSSLGLVEAGNSRFNSFRPTQEGLTFVQNTCLEYEPCYRNKGVLSILSDWVSKGGDGINPQLHRLVRALSPLEPLPKEAGELLRSCLENDRRGTRRKAALDWLGSLDLNDSRPGNWESRPDQLDEDHWHDLKIGAAFFSARDAALELLVETEVHLDRHTENQELPLENPLPQALEAALEILKLRAGKYLKMVQGAGRPGPDLARVFCQECSRPDRAKVLGRLVERDQKCLRLSDRVVVPGPAFLGSGAREAENDPEGENQTVEFSSLPLPPGISTRVHNLFFLMMDLNGELDQWLREEEEDEQE